MMNVVVLIGRLAQDPELRFTPSGVAVASFGLAVERPFTNQQGERDVDFINIVCWRRLAETVAEHLQKGRLVAVEGRLQVRSYEDREGVRRRTAEVVANDVRFLDWPSSGGGSGSGRPTQGRDDFDLGDEDFTEDDVPF